MEVDQSMQMNTLFKLMLVQKTKCFSGFGAVIKNDRVGLEHMSIMHIHKKSDCAV